MTQPIAALVAIEKALIGSVISYPEFLDDVMVLGPQSFAAPIFGVVLDVCRDFPKRRYDGLLVAHALERAGIPCPTAYPGWRTAIADFIDSASPNRDDVRRYLRVIVTESAARQAGLIGEYAAKVEMTPAREAPPNNAGSCLRCGDADSWPGRTCGNCAIKVLAEMNHALAWFGEKH